MSSLSTTTTKSTHLAIKKKPLWISYPKRPCNIILIIFIHHWDSTPPGCCFCWDSSEWTMHIYTHDPLIKNYSPSLLLSRAVESSVTVVVDPSPTPCQSLVLWIPWACESREAAIIEVLRDVIINECDERRWHPFLPSFIPATPETTPGDEYTREKGKGGISRARCVDQTWCVCLYFCMLDWFLRVKCIMAQSHEGTGGRNEKCEAD